MSGNEYLMSRRARDLRTALRDLRPLMSVEEADEIRNRLDDVVAPFEHAERVEHQRQTREWIEQISGHANTGNKSDPSSAGSRSA